MNAPDATNDVDLTNDLTTKTITVATANNTEIESTTGLITDATMNAISDATVKFTANRHLFARLPEINTLELADAAARYVWSGIPIFPLKAGGKTPATRHGLKDATTDGDRVLTWWHRHPDHNIGIPTGAPFGDVLDVDHKNGTRPGLASFLRLRGADLAADAWAIASTPTGGLHVVWAPTGLANTTRAAVGLDVRGRGGYIVAAPSVIDGRPYRWELIDTARYGPPLPWAVICELLEPPAPAGIVWQTVYAGAGGPKRIDGLYGYVASRPKGERNELTFWACRRAIKDGLDPELLRPAARAAGLPDSEINRIIASAIKAGDWTEEAPRDR